MINYVIGLVVGYILRILVNAIAKWLEKRKDHG